MVSEDRDNAGEVAVDPEAISAFLKRHENGNGNGIGPAGTTARASAPKAPGTIQETGLSTSFLLELMLKVFHYVETPTAEHLARVMCVPNKIVNDLLDVLKGDKAVEIVGGGTYGVSTAYKFRLTEKGEARAEQALERCRYAGAAPVTLEQYERVIGGTDAERWRPTLPVIREAFSELVLDDRTIDFLERALHSGRTLMLYGPSGNGKTHVLTEFIRHLDGEVLMPTSLYAYGQIIRLFDPMVHERLDTVPKPDNGATLHADESWDRRWIRVRRPGLIVGGEFTEESLELGYDPITRFYQAPKHLKAQGGVLVVDDFGRQKVAPTDMLNRWIMALERGRDNLLLRTGESIDVPFHITILFSTNLNPADLADSAYLRRVPYKSYMPPADSNRFADILRGVVEKRGMQVQQDAILAVAKFLDEVTGNDLSGSLARDLVTIVCDNAEHEGRDVTFDVPSFELAYRQFTGIPDGEPLAPLSQATSR
jgi:predicted ATPase with chaperone activity